MLPLKLKFVFIIIVYDSNKDIKCHQAKPCGENSVFGWILGFTGSKQHQEFPYKHYLPALHILVKESSTSALLQLCPSSPWQLKSLVRQNRGWLWVRRHWTFAHWRLPMKEEDILWHLKTRQKVKEMHFPGKYSIVRAFSAKWIFLVTRGLFFLGSPPPTRWLACKLPFTPSACERIFTRVHLTYLSSSRNRILHML